MPVKSAQVTITVDGKPEFNRVFSRYDALFDDLSSIWPDVRDEFWRIEAEQFDSEGSKGGSGRWQEHSARYAAQKLARYGPGLKILERTGELKESLTGDNPGSYFATSKTEIAVGTTIPHGVYHHRGEGRMPERKVISFSETQKDSMSTVIHGALIRELRTGAFYVPVTDR
jgi:hypothetical protein